MASLGIGFPILPGKTAETKRFIAEVTGPRRNETEESLRLLGLTKVNWYLQQTPGSDMVVSYVEGEDPWRSYQQWTQSDRPYDLWFKQQLESIHGIDFNQLPPSPLSEQVFEWEAEC